MLEYLSGVRNIEFHLERSGDFSDLILAISTYDMIVESKKVDGFLRVLEFVDVDPTNQNPCPLTPVRDTLVEYVGVWIGKEGGWILRHERIKSNKYIIDRLPGIKLDCHTI